MERRRSTNSERHELELDTAELAKLMFAGLWPVLLVGGGATTILAGWFAHRLSDHELRGWAWALGVLSLLRLAIALWYEAKANKAITSKQIDRVRWWFSVFTLLYCLSFSGTTLYAFAQHYGPFSFLCALGTFMLCGGLSGRIGLSPHVLHLAGGVMLAALSAGLFLLPLQVTRIGVVLIACYGMVFYESTKRQYQLLVNQVRNLRTLRGLAERDALTGLYNRRHIETSLKAIGSIGSGFGLLFLDLDQFKAVNDTYGHAVGDTVLRQVATRLLTAVRAQDIVARFGGDEFAILLTSKASHEDAEQIARRINGSIAKPFLIDGHILTLGASIGIKMSDGIHGDGQKEFQMADEALYLAKKSGRGTFRFATT